MDRGRAAGHAARYAEIGRILTEEGFGAFAVGLGLPGVHRRGGQVDSTTPERLRRTLERLGPSGVKIGQQLSTRPDLLPAEYITELRRLQDNVTRVPFEDIERVIEEEFGSGPDKVFGSFEREPLASASIGQVHAATLKEGGQVVVKVQRPGVRHLVETDLDILKAQARRVQEHNLAPADLRVDEVARDFADAVGPEIDYLHEAENAERFRAAFAGDETVVIPRVHWGYTTRRVLTLDRVEGTAFNRLDTETDSYDRSLLGRRGVAAYLRQIFEFGFFHADPHPGNVFALEGDRVAFTDFGRVGTVSPGVGDAATDLLEAIVDRDADLATDALLEVSPDPGTVDHDRLARQMAVLIGKYHGAQVGAVDVGEFVNDMLALVREHRLGLPGDFVMLMGVLAVLQSVGREVDPAFNFLDVARPYAESLRAARFRRENLVSSLERVTRRTMRTLADLPSGVDHVLKRIAGGDFRVAVRPEGFEPLIVRTEELVDRLAFALLIAAFIIGFASLLSVERLPPWVHFLSGVGMVGAVGVASWMFASIFSSRRRGRKRML